MLSVVIQFFKDISPIKLALIGLASLIFVILFVIYLSKISYSDMGVLYSDLDIEDSNKVVQELENKKVPYQLLSNGTVIKVPKDQVAKARINLAQAGIPTKGSVVGYEIFDKEDSISTTNFSQNIKMMRALEGEITRTISGFEQIEKARVHLVLPQKEVFSKERLEPRASIILKFKKGKSLSKAEIDALSHLVVTSVPGLDIKNITIVDTKGKPLKLANKEGEEDFNNSKNEEYRIAYENRVSKVIEDLLEQSLGAGKVKAQVTADMNFDRTVTNYETYDPDSAVVRSTQVSDERERTPMGGEDNLDASVANNLPGTGDGNDQNKLFATIEKSDQTTNYEISKTIKNHISEIGAIKKLSIGILVDGTYKLNPETNSNEYIPRSKEELDKIANLVKVAIGFNEERNDQIEVVNMQFSSDFSLLSEREDNVSWLREELPNLFQTLVFAIVVVLILITVIRPIALKAFEIKKGGDYAQTGPGLEGGGILANEPKESETPSSDLERAMKAENSVQKINGLVLTHPQEAIAVLRKWLNEGS